MSRYPAETNSSTANLSGSNTLNCVEGNIHSDTFRRCGLNLN